MEQRIGSKIQPVLGAGTDPSYVPGITAPSPAGAAEADQEQEAAPEAEDEVTAPAEAEAEADAEADAEDEAEDEAEADDAPEAEAKAEAEDEAEADGPVFEVSDRRGSVFADRTGIRFRLDTEEAEFDWDEIGAVEIDTPRFARRFSVTVYTSTRRWFQADVDAPARGRLKQWTADLDVVLDAYFEQSEE